MKLLTSRFASPVILGCFLLVYIVLAFATDDTLTALIALTSGSRLLQLLLALLPVTCACRLFATGRGELLRRRALSGSAEPAAGLFDESVQLQGAEGFDRLAERLEAEGYRTVTRDDRLAASRGVTGFAARLAFLVAVLLLFAGILISITSRATHRAPVVEGEPIPTATGGGGVVQRIEMRPGTGAVLARDLRIAIAASDSGEAAQSYGLYPPALHRGYFVYPRYLGFSPMVRLSAPELPAGFQGSLPLSLYPAGKEESAPIPGSPYRIVFSVEPSADGVDPFTSGRVTYRFKIIKGEQVLATGRVPTGSEFTEGPFRLAIPDSRRMVLTDFVKDYGVLLIWSSLGLFLVSLVLWLPVRLLAPRREMLFWHRQGATLAFSRAEGRRREHNGVFHEVLDLVESGHPAAAGTRSADAIAR